VKTQERPLEIDFRLGEFSVEVSRLLTGRYWLLGQSTDSHDIFEGDFWGETVAEFSHSLGHKRTFGPSIGRGKHGLYALYSLQKSGPVVYQIFSCFPLNYDNVLELLGLHRLKYQVRIDIRS